MPNIGIISHFSNQKGIRTQEDLDVFAYNLMLSKGFVNTILPYLNYCYTTNIVCSPIKEDSKHISEKEY